MKSAFKYYLDELHLQKNDIHHWKKVCSCGSLILSVSQTVLSLNENLTGEYLTQQDMQGSGYGLTVVLTQHLPDVGIACAPVETLNEHLLNTILKLYYNWLSGKAAELFL
jgi:hypothetical protein